MVRAALLACYFAPNGACACLTARKACHIRTSRLPPKPHPGTSSPHLHCLPSPFRLRRLANSPYTVSLTSSIDTDVPGFVFTVSAALNSNAGRPQLNGTTVTVALYPNTTEAAACAGVPAGSPITTCTAVSGAGYSDNCQLSLPCIGQFTLRGCADVPSGVDGTGPMQTTCSYDNVGLNTTEWAQAPWFSQPTLTVLTTQ